MLTVIQRVKEARVEVNNVTIGAINQGLLVLCGFETTDSLTTLSTMLEKCLNYRLFSDEQGKMNLNLRQVEGGLLLVPQFTLVADTRKGLRPSFSKAAPPHRGKCCLRNCSFWQDNIIPALKAANSGRICRCIFAMTGRLPLSCHFNFKVV